MKTIYAKRHLTIHNADETETYEVVFDKESVLNFLNNSEDKIYISANGSFDDDGTFGKYIMIPSNGYSNKMTMPSNKAYIKAFGAGDIVIERCG